MGLYENTRDDAEDAKRIAEAAEQDAALALERSSEAYDVAASTRGDLDDVWAAIEGLRQQLADMEAQPPAEPAPEPPPAFPPTSELKPVKIPAPPAKTEDMITDPLFGTKYRALPPGVRHHYSQLQPFSPDNRRMITSEDRVYNLETGVLEPYVGGQSRWVGSDILSVESSGSVKINGEEVAQIGSLHAPESHEEAAADGSFAVWHLDGRVCTYTMQGVLIEDYGARTKVNWVRAAPTGAEDGVYMQGAGRTVLLKPGLAPVVVCDNNRHSDMTAGAIGGEACSLYVYNQWYVDVDGARRENAVSVWNSKTLETEALFGLDAWGRVEHVSCTGPYILISAGREYYNGDGGPADLLAGEIWAIQLLQDGKSVLRRILHHHSSYSSNYFGQPHAAASRDGRLIAFASDMWGENRGYVAHLE